MKQIKIFCKQDYRQLEIEVNIFLQEIKEYSNGIIYDIKFTEVLSANGEYGDFSCLIIYSKYAI